MFITFLSVSLYSMSRWKKTDTYDPLGLTGVRVTIAIVIVLTFLFFQISTRFFYTEYTHAPRKRMCIKNLPRCLTFGSSLAPVQQYYL
jgi:hypothetical protein